MARYTDDLPGANEIRAQEALARGQARLDNAQEPDGFYDDERTAADLARQRIEASRWAAAEAQEVRS